MQQRSKMNGMWIPSRIVSAALGFVVALALAGVIGGTGQAHAQAQAPTSTPVAAAKRSDSATAAPTSTSGFNADGSANSYVIVANDVLWLKVYQEDDLETKARVNREGIITLPLLGSVSVVGLTVEKAAEKIRSELDRRFIVNPQVNLSVAEYAKRKFTIMGQVARPGIYEYSGEERMTLLQAIGLAGGLTRLAAPSKTTLQRLEAGEYKNYKVDPDAVGKSQTLTQFYLQHDDVISVGTRVF